LIISHNTDESLKEVIQKTVILWKQVELLTCCPAHIFKELCHVMNVSLNVESVQTKLVPVAKIANLWKILESVIGIKTNDKYNDQTPFI
jgi:hypothetical protein